MPLVASVLSDWIEPGATIIGVLVAAGSLFFAAWQSYIARSVAQADFLLRLDDRFQEKASVHDRLIAGAWTKAEPTSEEFRQLIPYIGLFERIKVMIDRKVIDIATFDKLYGYRLDFLLWNEQVHNRVLANKQGWRGYISLQQDIDRAHCAGHGRERRIRRLDGRRAAACGGLAAHLGRIRWWRRRVLAALRRRPHGRSEMTLLPSVSATSDVFQPDRLAHFWWFVCERQAIWRRRVVERRPPPWTDDCVLRTERFTNVYRELDPGTRYAVEAILERDAPKPDKVFNVMLYRLIGRADTHAALGFQSLEDFDPDRLERTLKRLRDDGRPVFTAAYTVSAYSSLGSADKIENVARLLARLHAGFAELYGRIEASRSAAAVHAALSSPYGFGNFLAYQVLVDLLYPLRAYGNTGLLPYSHDDWASAGPGARRGIALLWRAGSPPPHLGVMRWLRDHQAAEFARLGLAFPSLLDPEGRPIAISLANVQNCLCEYHKYVKIREKTGRGRRKFTPPRRSVLQPCHDGSSAAPA